MGDQHWLAKSEPETYSIHDLARDGRTHWEGVRNYLARNYLRQMKEGDLVLFYHSNAEPAGVAGIARVAREAYPDRTALDPRSDYYDAGATEADPRWSLVDIAHVETLPRVVALEEIKGDAALAGIEVARKGSRLSVSPVSEAHFLRVLALAKEAGPVVVEKTVKVKTVKKTKKKATKKTTTAKKKVAAKKKATKRATPVKKKATKGAVKKATKRAVKKAAAKPAAKTPALDAVMSAANKPLKKKGIPPTA